MSLVSIIMPSLNVVSYIDECLRSAINQTLKDIEVICIDAGSTDGTREVIEKYALTDKRIRLIDSNVKSYGYQVNLGIHEATGEYIGILETDDYVDCEMYERLYDAAKKADADYVRADYDEIFEVDGRTICNAKHIFTDGKKYNVVMSACDIPEVFAQDISIWSGIYRRKFLNGYDIRLNETSGAAFQDIGFKLLTLSYARKIMYIKYSGYRYRMEREGCSSCNNNVLKYAWQEFKRLLHETDILGTNTCKYVLYRMIDIFLCEYNKLLLKELQEGQAGLYEEFVEPYYRCFKNIISDYLDNQIISYEEMTDYQHSNLKPLLENRIEYNKNTLEKLVAIQKYWDGMADKLCNTEVVIVSYGIRGKNALKQLMSRGTNVVAVCDNDESVRQQKVGVLMLSIEDAVKNYRRATYVISNKKYTEVLEKQLVLLGIPKINIILVERS